MLVLMVFAFLWILDVTRTSCALKFSPEEACSLSVVQGLLFLSGARACSAPWDCGSLSWDGAIYLWSLLSFLIVLQTVWLRIGFRVAFPLLTLHVIVPVCLISLYKQRHWISVVIYLHILSPGKLRHKQMLQWWEVDQILWVHESVAVLDIRDVSSLHSSPLSYFIWPSSQPGSGHRTQEHCTLHMFVVQDPAHPPAGQHQL